MEHEERDPNDVGGMGRTDEAVYGNMPRTLEQQLGNNHGATQAPLPLHEGWMSLPPSGLFDSEASPFLPTPPSHAPCLENFPYNDDSGYHSGYLSSSPFTGSSSAYPLASGSSVHNQYPDHLNTLSEFNALNQLLPPNLPWDTNARNHTASQSASPSTQAEMSKGKRPRSIVSTSTEGSSSSRRRVKQCVGRTASDLIRVPEGQEKTIQHFVERLKDTDQLPSEQDMRAMAKLVNMSFYHFTMWFGEKVRFAPSQPAHRPSPLNSINTISNIDAQTLRHIQDYIDQKRRQPCHSGTSNGKYRCTWGCGYSTDKKDQWKQHEETKLPQRIFVCSVCSSGQDNSCKAPHINHRPDKFAEHVKKCHPKEDAADVRETSAVDYAASFYPKCTYTFDNGYECGHTLSSWKKRIDHWIQHFEKEVRSAQSSPGNSPPSGKDQDENDDQEDDSGSKPNRPSPKTTPRPKPTTIPRRKTSAPQSTKTHKHQASVSRNSTKIIETNVDPDGRSPSWDKLSSTSCAGSVISRQHSTASYFMDVESFTVVYTQIETRFLALKVSVADCSASYKVNAKTLSDHSLEPAGEGNKGAWEVAANIARAMGIRYVWIESLCVSNLHVEELEAMYRSAALIVIAGWSHGNCSKLSHLAGTYAQLETMQTWIQRCVAIRSLHPLGHGAYSFVDKVDVSFMDNTRLCTSHQILARKVVLRNSTAKSDAIKAAHLHEIEIMIKFNHPHIAQFVAAYHENGYLSILMKPVADFNLSQVLNDPNMHGAERLSFHLRRWFLSLAEAVAHIHGHHCRHKDIKPANILVSNNEVLLSDFGTSLEFNDDESMSVGDAFMTPKYCAPEVAARGRRGRRADIWSLGCVFLEMATVMAGRTLRELHANVKIRTRSRERQDTYHQQQPALINWLSLLGNEETEEGSIAILEVTKRMLSKRPDARPTALEIVHALCPDYDYDFCNDRMAEPNSECHCCSSNMLTRSPISSKQSLVNLCCPTSGQLGNPLELDQCTLLFRGCPGASKAVDEAGWARRGWTMQEYLLSPRISYPTDIQAIYQCNFSQGVSCYEEQHLPLSMDGQKLQVSFYRKFPIRGYRDQATFQSSSPNVIFVILPMTGGNVSISETNDLEKAGYGLYSLPTNCDDSECQAYLLLSSDQNSFSQPWNHRTPHMESSSVPS